LNIQSSEKSFPAKKALQFFDEKKVTYKRRVDSLQQKLIIVAK
jgi:hypothetical protein